MAAFISENSWQARVLCSCITNLQTINYCWTGPDISWAIPLSIRKQVETGLRFRWWEACCFFVPSATSREPFHVFTKDIHKGCLKCIPRTTISAGVGIWWFWRPPSIVSDVPERAYVKRSPDLSLLTALTVSGMFTAMTLVSELIFVHCSQLFYTETSIVT